MTMMTILRATEEWQRAGVHYVRAAAMIREFGVDLLGNLSRIPPLLCMCWSLRAVSRFPPAVCAL